VYGQSDMGHIRTWLVGLLLIFTLAACLPETGPPPDNPYQALMLGEINADRRAAGVPELGWSPKLGGLAAGWACILADQNAFYHRDLTAVINDPEYANFSTLGENLAFGPRGAGVSSIENSWMNSPAHRAIMLSPSFTLVGVAYCENATQVYWVANFGALR